MNARTLMQLSLWKNELLIYGHLLVLPFSELKAFITGLFGRFLSYIPVFLLQKNLECKVSRVTLDSHSRGNNQTAGRVFEGVSQPQMIAIPIAKRSSKLCLTLHMLCI